MPMNAVPDTPTPAPAALRTHVIPISDPTRPFTPDILSNDPARPLEVEIGCGNGRFLATRASRNPDTAYLGIERLLGRVRKLDKKAIRLNLGNLRILRLEACYTFYYLLPRHSVRTVYVFFPDPWPKRRHHERRLFSPLFLDALWARLEYGGAIQIATDHRDYFAEIRTRFAADPRFAEIPAMTRTDEEQTEFEQLFRNQGLPIYACAYRALPAEEPALPPLTLAPDMEPQAERE
ncbi:MAG TPA: tRNA (guanosine(46)-N7)-methyltransferase TrmB [Kiritimatiellia bacterium]|jgi:tRNA (guanine-N7-)-methyltransferase|nr:tRNA (guanosine(46)-N7)-methyltransferase TrmB [Kiritimatiellia bacterium]HOM58254.1 tRNA (guanosine(46)-N7)-methyltransferase TrmB [Kiritimatiellia bacterium]HOR97467.1 tRNA (guanosine(46)-N7)-methyltransferase TrmB [Kiritimatiellia bacterium]HPK38051.1 tRNA (guanosine(46)-N7)-methyltransferase TrmB [Kiritimatiellia bacterium]HPW75149.1 tRNA (guanosine(46)-N7)-methyltransferase TrmB [Kiritimatiellia bacterium]